MARRRYAVIVRAKTLGTVRKLRWHRDQRIKSYKDSKALRQRQFDLAKKNGLPPTFEAYYRWYMQTAFWRKKRRQRMRIAGGKCEVCRVQGPALHVHHKTYDRLGREDLADLQVLCESCHRTLHPGMPPTGVKWDKQTKSASPSRSGLSLGTNEGTPSNVQQPASAVPNALYAMEDASHRMKTGSYRTEHTSDATTTISQLQAVAVAI